MKLEKAKRNPDIKLPTIRCRLGIHRTPRNHEKRFILAKNEFVEQWDMLTGFRKKVITEYHIEHREDYELAQKCVAFESMDEDQQPQ